MGLAFLRRLQLQQTKKNCHLLVFVGSGRCFLVDELVNHHLVVGIHLRRLQKREQIHQLTSGDNRPNTLRCKA
jgi:hypothetical protein